MKKEETSNKYRVEKNRGTNSKKEGVSNKVGRILIGLARSILTMVFMSLVVLSIHLMVKILVQSEVDLRLGVKKKPGLLREYVNPDSLQQKFLPKVK